MSKHNLNGGYHLLTDITDVTYPWERGLDGGLI